MIINKKEQKLNKKLIETSKTKIVKSTSKIPAVIKGPVELSVDSKGVQSGRVSPKIQTAEGWKRTRK